MGVPTNQCPHSFSHRLHEMARFVKFLLLFTFGLLLGCDAATGLRGLLESSADPTKAANGVQLQLFKRQFNASRTSSTRTASRDGRPVYQLNPTLEMAMQRSVLRVQEVSDMMSSSSYGSTTAAAGVVDVWGPSRSPGEYSVQLRLGTPPETVSLVLDTGNPYVWVATSGHNSNTYQDVQCSSADCQAMDGTCKYGVCYCGSSSGSGDRFSGTVATDTVVFSENDGSTYVFTNMRFGNSGGYGGGGVLGLGRSKNSFSAQLATELGANLFAYCLPSWDQPSWTSSSLFIGSWRSPYGMSFTPLTQNYQNPAFFYLDLTAIVVGATTVALPGRSSNYQPGPGSGGVGFIIDSAVTFTNLVGDVYTAMTNEIKKQTSYPGANVNGMDLCYLVKWETNPSLPSLSFIFSGGAEMHFPLENYFLRGVAGTSDDIACLGFVQGNYNILGNVQQQNFLFVFDNDNNQLGWSPVGSCSSGYSD